ncbi:hypothetical protein PY247_15180 [Acinetobacter proteolyticus]|nr:hypothetical protein [Acinetobacter proteolyticus]WEI17726.1 hypothetical protein PY247_15180 [Acinetobacter proteolyticus]
MFVQLNHLKSKELQSDLDAIQAVFEVSLFDIAHQTESSEYTRYSSTDVIEL